MSRSSLARCGFPILAGALPLALYAVTACRDTFWIDTTEFMLVGRYLAVSHPPGYPLLTLIVRLFSLGAGHDPNSLGGIGSCPLLALPFRLNLVPALAAAGSCVMAYLIVVELTSCGAVQVLGTQSRFPEPNRVMSRAPDRLAGLFSALLWGVSFELWQQATALEVYSFQALLLSVLLLAVVKWHGTTEPRWLLVGFFVFGLALANHTPIVLWIPSLVIMIWASPARPGARVIGFGVLLTVLAVGLYLYVPLRSSAPIGQFWTGVNSFSELVQFVSGRMYRYRLLGGGSGYIGSQVTGLPELFGRQFLAAWLLIIPGAFALWRSRRGLLIALLVGAAAVTAATAAYHIPDKEGYLLPAYFGCLIVIGCGFSLLLRSRFRPTATIAAAVLLVLPVLVYFPLQNRSRLHGLADLSRAVLSSLPPHSTVFTDDYSLYQGIRWQQQIVGYRTDVLPVVQHYLALPWYVDQLRRSVPVPESATDIVRKLWRNSGHVNDAGFGEQAKALSQRVMLMLARSQLPRSRVFWIPADFSNWPQDWNGLRLTMRGLGYEMEAQDTLPDLESPLLPASRYRSTLYRDVETQDLCRRLAATACRRGILRFAADNGSGAIRDFDLALQHFPDYPQAIENKGIVFFFSDQPDSARCYLNRFIALEPESPELPKVRGILARLGS